jgi:hypothetical protein
MEPVDATQLEPPSSDACSGTRERFLPSLIAALPLLQYHKKQHELTGHLLVQLFEIKNGTTAGTNNVDEVLERVASINKELRRLNIVNNLSPELGIIEADVFLYAWDRNLDQHLKDFCRLRHYPIGWARLPPETDCGYWPYENSYWEQCDWITPSLLLSFIWQLRKARVQVEIVEDQELILLEFECIFNRKLGQLHMEHRNGGTGIGFLRAEDILQFYSALGDFLAAEDEEGYEECRQNLRKECALYGYSNQWVPGTYLQEVCTAMYPW